MYFQNLVILTTGLALVLLFYGSNISKYYSNKKHNYFNINVIADYRDIVIITIASIMLLSIFIKFATIDFEKCLKVIP
jgi:hypothetical protein